ncbi:hypothetical protein NS274_06795 [Pseudomonas oryzihabitans]|uniref:hypothetical protein n=1 Tax=Pseudomonas rhizoryzae TaxID=2571129 RepID=UPI0007375A99|nr:hypothetical protein [Pseudomonas rhizoryzae]KTS78409.1 hypothetical protein NS274_06795 [Pseudomonas psychrotolerans]KTT29959.1 hypothetical protein NS201_15000 [Pseudomonas psychrotolerans]KTT35296.1 hypothetical protein SB9_09495 [Pseudomonas psychrotolerans]KTT40668.1 hypothetical protein SB5_05510 [Pseudomonas psychrotolerans]KTT45521.1 hypothetical protein RSA46_07125 [Pseudomonas psychrotolerans]
MKTNDRARSKDADRLSELLQEPHRSNRHDIWLWLHLYHYKEARLDLRSCNGLTMRDEIAKALKNHRLFQSRIPQEKDRLLLPNEKLGWIEEDERQHRWLIHEIEKMTDLHLPRALVHLTGRDRLIGMIDLWDVDIADKASEVDQLHRNWLRHKAKDSEFEWFTDKKESEKRCVCAWEWLQKNHLSPITRQTPISNYQELLMFFDQGDVGRHERTAMIREIKRRWNRKQFGERTADKKQVNLLLSKEAIDQLDALSQKHGLKRAQIVEALIAMETEVGLVFIKK